MNRYYPRSILQLTILEILAWQTLNVYQIYDEIIFRNEIHSRHTGYPTIYRSVESLEEHGMIKAIGKTEYAHYRLTMEAIDYLRHQQRWLKAISKRLEKLPE